MVYYLKKLWSLMTTLFLVSLITFLVFQILPGNPAEIILGVDADPAQIAALEQELNLNLPPLQRYFLWLGNLLQGNMGDSIRYHQPVFELITNSFFVTLGLALIALVLTVIIAVPCGIFLAVKQNSRWSILYSAIAQLGISTPSFCVGIVFISIFCVWFKLLPSMGYVSFFADPFAYFRFMVLPAFSIALGTSAVLMRYVKVCILQQLSLPYVKTARSKGASQRIVLYGHVLRNSLIPAITMLGMIVADVLGGSVIIENVFSLPGIGNLILSSISSRDLPLVQGLILYLTTIVVLCNFLVDMLYSVIDPRIRVR